MLFILLFLLLIVCFKNRMCQFDIQSLFFAYKSESKQNYML